MVSGQLKMHVASEGKIIYQGTDVVVSEKQNGKNLWIEIQSMTTTIRLPFGTRIGDLV
jgi:hypothetical protein